jgi:hypothetical protein
MDFSAISANSFWAVPLVVAIVEAFKMSGFNVKFAPIISLVVGLAISFAVNTDLSMGEIIVSGIIFGLTASGLYSQVKSTANVRGKVPLRTDQEAVIVETFEVEKPLGTTTVQADSNLQVNQTIVSSTSGEATQQPPKPQQEQPQQSQAEKPILEKNQDQL